MDQHIADNITPHFIGHTFVEHFDESLVLLRRKLCWKMKDIIYHAFRNASYTYKHKNYDQHLTENFQKWHSGDTYFYR